METVSEEVKEEEKTQDTGFLVTPEMAGIKNDTLQGIIDFIERPDKCEAGTEDHLQECVLRIGNFLGAYTEENFEFRGRMTVMAINAGKMFNALKKVAKLAGVNFELLAAEHFPGISASTRQNYMSIARHEYSQKYAILGVERLLLLIKVTKEIKEKKAINNPEPIEYLLDKYCITIPDPDEPVDEFKKRVDAAIFVETAELAGGDS